VTVGASGPAQIPVTHGAEGAVVVVEGNEVLLGNRSSVFVHLAVTVVVVRIGKVVSVM
jgi:hypothetical protein